MDTPYLKNGPFSVIAHPSCARKDLLQIEWFVRDTHLTRMPIAQRGRVMAPPLINSHATLDSFVTQVFILPRVCSSLWIKAVLPLNSVQPINFLHILSPEPILESTKASTRPETLNYLRYKRNVSHKEIKNDRSMDTCPQIFPLADKYWHVFAFIIHSSRSKNKRLIKTFDSFEPIEIYPKLILYKSLRAIISIANRLFA